MAIVTNFNMIKIYLIILCISILGQQCLANINSNNSTENSKILEALQPLEGRIVNGIEAKVGQFPYQAFVSAVNTIGTLNCGGAIIDNKTVVTSAQCVYNLKQNLIPADKITIFADGLNRNYLKKFKVAKVIPHEKYDPKTIENDIALLITENSFGEPTKTIAPIAVTSSKIADNTECIVSGWGATSSSGKLSDKLMYTQLNILNHKSCKQNYKNVPDSTICALSKTSNTCSGDYGAPLTANNKLIGMVSLQVLYCTSNRASIYTDVYQYRNWIEKNRANFGISYQMIGSNQFMFSILLSSFIMYFKY